MWFYYGLLMEPHPLTNFEIQKYYRNDPKFDCVYSHDNLQIEIKVGAYVINLHDYAKLALIGLLCMLVISSHVTYFNNFGIEYITKYFHHIQYR